MLRALAFSIMLCVAMIAMPGELFAQKRPGAPGSETAAKRAKKTEKAIQSTKGYSRTRQGALMDRSYRKSPGRYSGNIEMRPKSLDYNAIRERTERNPGRKNLKTQKNRESYYRASSGRMQRSLGKNTVRLGAGQAPRAAVGRPGGSGLGSALRPGSRYYQKKSMEMHRDQGNIAVTPASKRRDFNEIRNRVDPNPSRTGYRNVKAAQATRSRKSAETQSFAGSERTTHNRLSLLGQHSAATSGRYRGDVKAIPRTSQRQYYRAESRSVTGYSGDGRTLKPAQRAQAMEGKSMNSSQYSGGFRAMPRGSVERYYRKSSESSGQYRGDLTALRPKYRGQALQGKALNASQYDGEIVVSGRGRPAQAYSRQSRITGSYSGDLKTRGESRRREEMKYASRTISRDRGSTRVLSKASQDRWYRRDATITGNYQGDQRAPKDRYRKQELQGKSLNVSRAGGTISVLSPAAQARWYRRDAAITGNYRGNLLTKSEKARKLELEGKSLNSSTYQGTLRARSAGAQERHYQRSAAQSGGYRGDSRVKKERYHNREMEGKSLAVSRYAGSVKVLSKESQDRWYRRDSKTTGAYQGDLVALKPKYSRQALEGKSLNSTQYSGSVRTMTPSARDRNFRNLSDRNLNQTANFRTKSRFYRNLEHQYLSATVHNYQGGPKVSLATRLWLSVTDSGGDRLKKSDNTIRKPRYDTREAKIWY